MPRAELRRHTVVVLSVCHYAEGCYLGILLSVRPSDLSVTESISRRSLIKLSVETSNTSRYRYLLGFVFQNFRVKASFVSYGVICLP